MVVHYDNLLEITTNSLAYVGHNQLEIPFIQENIVSLNDTVPNNIEHLFKYIVLSFSRYVKHIIQYTSIKLVVKLKIKKENMKRKLNSIHNIII